MRWNYVLASTFLLGSTLANAEPDPADPTEPTESTESTEPTEPSEQATPAEPAAPIEPTEPTTTEPKEVFFDFDRSEVRPDGEEALRAIARHWKKHPGETIVLAGHADPRGTGAYNVGLSIRRAKAVRDRLIQLCVSRDRIILAMYGEDGPRRESFAEDRRVTMTATNSPLYVIVDERLGKEATAVTWSRPVTIAEIEGPRPQVARR